MMSYLPVVPLILVAVSGLAMLLLDAFAKERTDLGFVAAVAMLMASVISAVALAKGAPTDGLPEVFRAYLGVDALGLYSDVVIAGSSGLVALIASGYLREHGFERGELYILLLFTTLGAMILGRGIDLLTIAIGLETLSLGSYAMIAFRRTSARAVEAAMKYFLLGSLGAAIFLFGAALLYGATGHTDLAGIREVISSGAANVLLLALGLVFVVSGLAFKVSVVPFHMWAPDAYEGAMTPVTTFMSVVVKSAAFVLVARLLVGALGHELSANFVNGWPGLFAGLATISVVFGSVASVAQTSVKRMLAYSSIANAGFIALAIAAAPRVGAPALTAALYYLLTYAASSIAAFGGLVLLGSRGLEAVSYDDLSGVGRRHPWLALPLAMGAVSLMGFPPSAGFFGKWYVLNATVQGGTTLVVFSLVSLLATVFGAYAYLRILVHLYAREPEPGAPKAIPMRSGYVVSALAIAGVFVLALGLDPTRYLRLARLAAAPFFGG